MGTKGSLYLTSAKGLLFQEKEADAVPWEGARNMTENNAAVITAGKTLKLSNDPWAHRGKPVEIDADSDDTRDELVSFLDHVRRNDPKTICDVNEGLRNAATALIGNEAIEAGKAVAFPTDLKTPL